MTRSGVRVSVLLLLLAVLVAGTVSATVLAARVTVADTATVVFANTAGNPVAVVVLNKCTEDVFLGGAGVATTTGLELDPEASVSIVTWPGETLYGIVASSTCRVDVLSNRR